MFICCTLFGMAAAISCLWVSALHAWWTSQQVHSLDELQSTQFDSRYVSVVAPPLRSAASACKLGALYWWTRHPQGRTLKAGFSFPTTLVDQLEAEPHAAKRQIFTTQPRGKRLRPLVSEFQAYKSILFPLNAEPAIQQFLKTLPKGSRICHRTLTEGFFLGWQSGQRSRTSCTPQLGRRATWRNFAFWNSKGTAWFHCWCHR